MLRNIILATCLVGLAGCGVSTSEEIQSNLQRAQGLLEAGSPREADTALRDVIALDPANVEAIFLRGVALERLERWVEAYAHYRRAAGIEPAVHKYGVAAVALEVRARRWDDARQRLESLQNGGLAEAQFNLWRARIAAGERDDELALTLYSALVNEPNPDATVLAEAAQVAQRAGGQQELAAQLVKRAIEQEPGHPLAELVSAHLHLERGEEERGIELLRNAVARDGSDIATVLMLASLEYSRGEVDSAARRYERLASAAPFDETAILAYGEFLARDSKLEELGALVDRIEPRSPALEGVRSYLRALTLVAAGKVNDALSAFDEAVLLLPGQPGPWLSLGRAAVMNGELNRAENALGRALELAPGLVAAELEMARIEMLNLEPGAAHERLRRIKDPALMKTEVGLAISEAELLMHRHQPVLARSDAALAGESLAPELRARWERVRARALEASGSPEQAKTLYAELLSRSPDNLFAKLQHARLSGSFAAPKLETLLADEVAAKRPGALVALGVAKWREGDLEGAASRFEEAWKGDPFSYEANLYLGLIAYQEGDLEDAEKHFDTVLSLAPGDPLANQYVGLVAQRRDNLDRAQEYFERALRAERRLAASHTGLAEVLLDRGEVLRAARSARAAVDNAPKSLRARHVLTRVLLQEGDSAQALSVALGMTKDAPKFDQGWLLLGRAARASGDLEQAVQGFSNALELNPRLADSLIALVEVLSAQENFDKAAKLIKARLAARPTDGMLLRLAATIELNRGDAPAALAHLESALSAEPNNPATAVLVARTAVALGDDERGVRALRAVADLPTTPAVAPLMLGALLERLSRADEAIEAYRVALAKAPEHSAVLNNLAWLLHAKSDSPEEALRLARRAYLIEPDSVPIIDTLGKILIDQGLVDEAYATLQAAAERAPAERDLAFRLAQAAQAFGRPDEASELIGRALANPEPWPLRADAKRLLASIETAQ